MAAKKARFRKGQVVSVRNPLRYGQVVSLIGDEVKVALWSTKFGCEVYQYRRTKDVYALTAAEAGRKVRRG